MKTLNISGFLILFIVVTAVILCAQSNAYAFLDFEDIDLKVRTGVSEIYDDNITYRCENEISDFITNLSLGLGLKYEGKTRSLELDTNVFYQIFSDNSSFNNTSENLSLSFRQEFSKYDRISITDTFSHTHEPRSFEDAFGRTSDRYSYYRNRFYLDYNRDVTRQFNIIAKYSNEINAFSKEGMDSSYLNKIGLGAEYFFSSTTGLTFSCDFTYRNFDSGIDAFTHTIAAGLRHYLTGRLCLDVTAGADLIHSYDEEDYIQPVFRASLTGDIGENTAANIAFDKQYYLTSYSEDLFDQWRVSGAFTKQVFKRLGCSVSGFYGKGEYVLTDITDNLQGGSAGFSYDFNENLKGNLKYTYSQKRSNDETREYIKKLVSLGLTLGF